jgi:transcriptional regulator with XRE-family HTH domain
MARSSRGISLAELARRTRLSVSYLSMLERGDRKDPTLTTIEKIAIALGVPVGIFFFLAADRRDLSGIDPDLAGKLASAALEFLNEPDAQPTLL